MPHTQNENSNEIDIPKDIQKRISNERKVYTIPDSQLTLESDSVSGTKKKPSERKLPKYSAKFVSKCLARKHEPLSYSERVFWNLNTYGKAITIRKTHLRLAWVVICLMTPLTNWTIPFVTKIIQNDLIWRY